MNILENVKLNFLFLNITELQYSYHLGQTSAIAFLK